MQDSEYLEPLSDGMFAQEMDKPSTLNDVFFDSLSPDYNQHFWQSHRNQHSDSGMTLPPPPQNGGMVQGDFSLDDSAMGQQGAGFDLAPTGNIIFGSAPGGLAVGGFGSGSGGHSAVTRRAVTPGPGANQKSSPSSVWQPGSEFDDQPGSSSTLGGDS